MFDFVRLPNPIERLEFDLVRLVFCSVLFDWIGRVKREIISLSINLSISRTETRNVRFFPAFFVSIKFIKSVAASRSDFAILILVVAMRLYK